ncbi:phytoene/squalene synthase family protein [Blastochloris sulfoviridis]|uniref:Phytoene/squalene synthase family protein n=1 Tax=Blastochloris sulfoviridis TaxID=50712 RepID=A0A5M6I4B8_9HYPH|nr:phytoene/squalene synthase family protein [Blastochloris sulfoviridis]KAA5603054.1 phytoene/squalene synthase family protein [Blastochloris sulfoviridis]
MQNNWSDTSSPAENLAPPDLAPPDLAPPDPCLAADDVAACRELLRNGSRSFYTASMVLPPTVRTAACTLYAFCRVADDAVDLGVDRCAALEALRERLDRAYAGRPMPDPVDRAFAETVERYAVPRALPEALLEGFAWDSEGRRYDDFSGVVAYSARVAAAVGAMMTVLMGVRAPDAMARACDLGVAMQLTNIVRDVGEDARAGRIYLPLDWMREAGLDPDAFLADPVFDARLAAVVKRMIEAADRLYVRSEAGIARLPLSCRPGIWAARLIYAEIGREVARNGYDSVSQRAVVSAGCKARLLGRALTLAPLPGRSESAPPLPEVAFLVDAVAGTPEPTVQRGDAEIAWWDVNGRVAAMIDMFATVAERERDRICATHGIPPLARGRVDRTLGAR